MLLTPVAIEDSIRGEEEVSQVLQSLKRFKGGGLLDNRAEDLKDWLKETSRETNPVTHRCRLLVIFIQNNFEYGTVPKEGVWETMVVLPKGRGGIRK